MTALGRIYLPAGNGTPVGQFEFLVDRLDGIDVEIGTPVAADTDEGTLIGTVVDMRTVGIDRDPVAADKQGRYEREDADWSMSRDAVVAQVQVFHSPTLRPARSGLVRAATRDELLTATGADDIDWPVSAGVVQLADGTFAPIQLDGHNLLGSEGAHLTIGGISGQAAKSSYAGMLLKASLAAGDRSRTSNGQVEESVGCLVFNLKGADLLMLDQPPKDGDTPDATDQAIYAAMGLDTEPFEHVLVYAPAQPAGHPGVQSARDDALKLQWGLADIFPYLKHVAGDLYANDNSRLFLEEFRDLLLYHSNPHQRIDTFAKLETWFDDIETDVINDHGEPTGEKRLTWRSHHPATLLKMKKRLLGLKALFGGLVADGAAPNDCDVTTSGWAHGQIVVVDLAALDPKVKALVVARTVERLYGAAEAGELGVEHLIVWADELNEFAPKDAGGDMATVKKSLQRVSTQGRYAGISLFGMAQQLSKVDELVRDNAATRALGRTMDGELSSGVYGRLSRGVTEQIVTLPRGQMCVWHYTLRAPLVVRFPRPCWHTGVVRNGGGRAAAPKPTQALGLTPRSVEELTRGIPNEVVTQTIADSSDPAEARRRLERSRITDPRRDQIHEQVRIEDNPYDPFPDDPGEIVAPP